MSGEPSSLHTMMPLQAESREIKHLLSKCTNRSVGHHSLSLLEPPICTENKMNIRYFLTFVTQPLNIVWNLPFFCVWRGVNYKFTIYYTSVV